LDQVRGGAEFQAGGILQYFEDLKRGANKDICPLLEGLNQKTFLRQLQVVSRVYVHLQQKRHVGTTLNQVAEPIGKLVNFST
jgi:hypothetical protein